MYTREDGEARNLRDYLTRVVEETLRESVVNEGAGKNDDDKDEAWVKDGFTIRFAIRSDGRVCVERIYAEMDTSPMGCCMMDDNGVEVFADLDELLDGDHPEWFGVG